MAFNRSGSGPSNNGWRRWSLKNVVEKMMVEKVKVATVAKVAVVPSFVPRSLAPSKSKKMSSNGAKSVDKSSGSVEKEKVVDSEAALLDSFLSSV